MENAVIIKAAGGLVVNDDGQLLLIYRRGKWDLPKGKWDEGETIEQCALREVEEETGVGQLTLGSLAGITKHYYYDKYLRSNACKETHWFHMRTAHTAALQPQLEEDIQKAIWADGQGIYECMQNSFPNIISILQQAGWLSPLQPMRAHA